MGTAARTSGGGATAARDRARDVGGAAAVRSTMPEKEGSDTTPQGDRYHEQEPVNESGNGGLPASEPR